MALDSEAFFTSRLSQLGLEDHVNAFAALGWTTMAKFGFGANYVPGRADEAPFINDIIVPLFGDANSPQKPVIRRLFFEAYTMAASDIQRRTSKPYEEDKPKKIPVAERAARFKLMQDQLSGLTLTGELEPSNLLVDKLVEMEDSGELRYIKWEECTKRLQEMNGIKKDEMWKEDGEGRLKRVFTQGEDKADLKDHLMLRYALQRRGVALGLARLMSFKVHEKLINFFFEELARDPLPGYSQVTLEQVRRADKEVFLRLAEKTRGGIVQIAGDELPLDQYLDNIIEEPRICALLFPLQGHSRSSGSEGNQHKRGGDEVQRLREEVKRLKSSDFGNKGKGKGKGKGNSKGKGEGKRTSMPKELFGMCSTYNGQPLCFSYNTSRGCISGVEKCERGLHKCAFPGCGGDHPLKNCTKKVGG
jgi:hypothetical protein